MSLVAEYRGLLSDTEGLGSPAQKVHAARERELFRYFDPPAPPAKAPTKATQYDLTIEHGDPLSANPPSSPETTLTALAQLCALRLNASRAMVSVIAKDTQYFIAEATKTLDLVDNQYCDDEGDDLWVGCASVDKSGRLCERTIELPPNPDAYPCFTVTDLSEDERFNQLPFVTGPPHFRFYAGTPLTTRNGVNIGSLFILDDKVRPRLQPAQEQFLGTIAATIMSHMEVNKEAEERKKVLRMAKGLNAFVEGKSSFEEDNQRDERAQGEREDETARDTESAHANIESAHKATFSRAANLLRDSLNLRNHGGVCFVDTVIGPRGMALKPTGIQALETESESDTKESPTKGGRGHGRDNSLPSRQEKFERSSDTKVAEVISSSCSKAQARTGNGNLVTGSFMPPTQRFLQSLLKHYPRGKVWIFDGVEGLTSEEDEIPSPSGAAFEEQRRRRLGRKQLEKATLKECFPGVYELLFIPLWDAGTSRWFSGCFCWRTSANYKLSIEAELQFVTAFGNSIMAEISRLASIYESRQKGDFIGSISHELRSPLHGILGSAEFLSETNFDTFQGSLIDTISSCGRTLLDTIEHILDFSKINSFERNWRNARKQKHRNRSTENNTVREIVAKEAPPMMSIYAVIDVAAIVEEVVEGVYAGQVYRDFGSADIADVSAGQSGKTSNRGLPPINKSLLGGSMEQQTSKSIEVILDIEKGDFCFTTQPGALRRVVMNVFGNSLKYTTAGKIAVKLRLDDPKGEAEARNRNKILDITVTDTGKGISGDYLRTSLYTAFSQEDVLANGTGLGLSIVRSIVTMLEGTIDIKSQVGQGTEVQIRLPLDRAADGATTMSTPSSVGSPDKLVENSISVLQTEHSATKISIHAAEGGRSGKETETDTTRVTSYYVKEWFGMPMERCSPEDPTDVVIVGEGGLPDLLQQLRPGPAIVVLCSKTHRLQAAQSLYPGAIEFMSTPFGPYKLAKAIRLALEKANRIAAGVTPQLGPTIQTLHTPRTPAASISSELESMTLSTDDEGTPLQVVTNGIVTASRSNNAQRALGSASSVASGESRGDFPFPTQSSHRAGNDSPRSAFGDIMMQYSSRPKLLSRSTEPVLRPPSAYTSALSRQGVLATSNARTEGQDATGTNSVAEPEPFHTEIEETGDATNSADEVVGTRPPRILLVDDNNINLRLLETFMRKRKYELVDSAVDGSLAVEAAKKHEQGYDIIFMDLSMPVMNGFEATRAIRELEKTRDPSGYAQAPKAAMIVALTGLASGRDHGEAFACGVDLYMTKPVSFKEVGRLLDNWEAHGGLNAPQAAAGGKEKEKLPD